MFSRALSSFSLPQTTLSALAKSGYETLQDISGSSAESLAQDAKIPLTDAQAIMTVSQKLKVTAPLLFTQSAASMVKELRKFTTYCIPVDSLLSGGLSRGHILEISGSPGTPKETIAIGVARAFVEAGEGILFVDAQNMTPPALLNKNLQRSSNLPHNFTHLVYHLNVQTLPDLMVFVHNLPTLLKSHPQITLLVLNSISYPFHSSPHLTNAARIALLEKIKLTLLQVSTSSNLTIVSTSQLATKLLNADGSAGSFESGARGIMVPQLGPGYLPSGRTHRLIMAPNSRTSGVVKLLSSPTYQPGTGPAPRALYTLDNGSIIGTVDGDDVTI